MKRIFVSQRVDIITDYDERRDALDQRWSKFLYACGCLAIPMPNHTDILKNVLGTFPPDGILLTGGNSHTSYGGNAPERDEVDFLLLNHAVLNSIPLIGVCRGMQSIVLYFNGTLRKTEGHIAVNHDIIIDEKLRTVNSYHSLSVNCDGINELEKKACALDGSVEAVCHKYLPISGIMWHPERNRSFDDLDIQIFVKHFDSKYI